jgi:hypothetical protein
MSSAKLMTRAEASWFICKTFFLFKQVCNYYVVSHAFEC